MLIALWEVWKQHLPTILTVTPNKYRKFMYIKCISQVLWSRKTYILQITRTICPIIRHPKTCKSFGFFQKRTQHSCPQPKNWSLLWLLSTLHSHMSCKSKFSLHKGTSLDHINYPCISPNALNIFLNIERETSTTGNWFIGDVILLCQIMMPNLPLFTKPLTLCLIASVCCIHHR